MTFDKFHEYCMAKPGTEETFPFGETTLVFKVMGKMYALCGLDETPLRINLKCEPERAAELRERYPESILPGYHMNKKLWNTVVMDGALSDKLLLEMTDHSYDEVVKGLKKADREKLSGL